MATTILNHKRVTLSIEEKAKLLQVISYEPGVLAVRSGSDARIAYAIAYDDHFQVTSCACTGCKQYGRKQCAYRLAAAHKLAEMKRDYHCEMFGLYQYA